MIIETRGELQMMLVGVACVIAGGISLMTFLKWREVRAASHWLPVPGKIVSSGVEQRAVVTDQSSNATEIRNFPAITFEYLVGDRKLRGTRYSLSVDVGNGDIATTLARFPKGRAVTVYYDPADPTRAVIERTLPDGAIKTMMKLSAALVAGAVVLVFGITGLFDVLTPHLPNPQNGGIVLFLSLAGLALWRMQSVMLSQAAAARAWPTAKGRVVKAGVEQLSAVSDRNSVNARLHTVFRSRVSYEYRVAGQRYVGERVAFGAVTSANWVGLVSGRARAYPPGSDVEVLFDPANPAEAVLEPRVAGLWLLWLVTAVCAAGAAAAAGFL